MASTSMNKNNDDDDHSDDSSDSVGEESSTSLPAGTSKTQLNRLANEKSPYLIQHATNPVDWYPWCNEALEKAKKEDKPIFLSIGYSTCHWCHVMENESFENEVIAAIMNENFINIKVDREERPDVDKVYMTYVQATAGSGGWPLSVWLTPDLTPIYGGTYFPPNDRFYGRPGFTTVIQAIAKRWKEDRNKVQQSGDAVMKLLEEQIKIKAPTTQDIPGPDTIQRCFQIYSKSYDPVYGGFSKSPKFPQAGIFNFLSRYYAHHPTANQNQMAKEMCLHTLKLMARGGIHDHLAKGFHRYSTDEQWHVPHFEKMLYDQAQLATVYVEAYQISHESVYADVANGILVYVSRDLSDDLGGFYSAEDADSYPTTDSDHKKEGAFCVWTKKEVEKILDVPLTGSWKHKLHDLMCAYFDIREGGNVNPYLDPHEELKNKNVLIIRNDKEKLAKEFGLSLDELLENLQLGCKLMYEARLRRPVPHLDDKMIASWNGLMLRGFVKVGMILDEKKYIDRAILAATFIRENLYDPYKHTLLRSAYHSGVSPSAEQISEPVEGFVDDYAFVIQGLMDLYEGTGNTYWLQWAEELQKKQDELFWDSEAGGYFITTGNDPTIILRMKEDQDGAEPSANSVSVMNLLRLAVFLDDPKYQEKAKKILNTFMDRILKVPHAVPQMMCGLIMYHLGVKRIVVAGDWDSTEVKALMREIHSCFLPNKVIIYTDDDKKFLQTRIHHLSEMQPIDGKATVYICEGTTCSLPITTVEELRAILQSKRHPV